MPQIITSDGREVLSASFLYEEWGVASGNLVMIESPSPGEKITIERGDIPLFSGVVTKVRYIHEDNEYRVEIKDPVSAILSGEAEFEGGEIGAVLGSILASLDCSFSGTSSIKLFGTVEDPIQWVDLIRSVCLATGKVFRYLPDGNYELVSPSSVTAVDPLDATTGIAVDRYANQVVVTVDGDWTEDVDPLADPTVTVETGYGITRTVTKIGEQVQSVVSNLGDGRGVSESWTWDTAGNLTRYDKAETAELERTTSYTTYTIGTGDSLVIYEESVVERRANPLADWYFYRRYRKTTSTYLDDEAPVQIDEYVDWYFQEESLWHSKEWIRRFGLPKMPGILESSRNEYYEYSETDSLFHLQRTTNEGGLPKPDISKVLQVKKHSVHLSATAADEDSVTALGAVEKSLSLHGIADTSVLETAAENYLNYCSRCKSGSFTLPAAPFLIGDFLSWNGEEWVIDTVAFNLTSEDVVVECSSIPPFSEIEGALGVDSEDIGTAVVHLLEKKSKRLNNVARATVVAQIDYESYQVRVQGEAAGKTRTARVDYQAGVRFPPGKEVLLGRPTGKGVGWEILTRRHDDPTVVSYVPVSPGIGTAPSITAFTGNPDSGLNSVEVEFTIAFSGEISSQTISYGDKLPLRGELSGTGELPEEGEIGEAFLIGVDRHVWDGSAWRNIGPEMDTLTLKGSKVSTDDLSSSGARKYDIWKVGSDFWYWDGSAWVSAGEVWPKLKHLYVKTKEGGQELVPIARLGWSSMGILRSTPWVDGETITLGLILFTATPMAGVREFPFEPFPVLFAVDYGEAVVDAIEVDFGDGESSVYTASMLADEQFEGIQHDYFLSEGLEEGQTTEFSPKVRLQMGEALSPWIDLKDAPIVITKQSDDAMETYISSASAVGPNSQTATVTFTGGGKRFGWRQPFKLILSGSAGVNLTAVYNLVSSYNPGIMIGGLNGMELATGTGVYALSGQTPGSITTCKYAPGKGNPDYYSGVCIRYTESFSGRVSSDTTNYPIFLKDRFIYGDVMNCVEYDQFKASQKSIAFSVGGMVSLQYEPPSFSEHVVEPASDQPDGSETVFYLPSFYSVRKYWKQSSLKVFLDDVEQVLGVDYVIQGYGAEIAFPQPPASGTVLTYDYYMVPVGGCGRFTFTCPRGIQTLDFDIRVSRQYVPFAKNSSSTTSEPKEAYSSITLTAYGSSVAGPTASGTVVAKFWPVIE